jgi:SAM-dependent methyltransferase
MTPEKGWFTRFSIGDWETEGIYDPVDRRLPLFFDRHHNLERVLELSCFEGGHTIELAKRCGSLVTVDGRERNIEKAKLVVSKAGLTNVEFHHLDLENPWPDLGKFTVVFCLGFLYHIESPVKVIKNIRSISPELFLTTHVSTREEANTTHEDLVGHWYTEPMEDPRSGMRPRAFWPLQGQLVRALKENGFKNVECEDASDIPVLHSAMSHPAPYVAISAKA